MRQLRYGILLLCLVMIAGLHPFLALTRPVDADVLVVEGWIPDACLTDALEIFNAHHYALILTNGGKLEHPHQHNGATTYADLAKTKLVHMGVDEKLIIAVPTEQVQQSRTFSFAQSTVEWLRHNRPATRAFNVLTHGTHARKSFVLYQKASENQLQVGIISAPPVTYNPLYWYLSGEGIGFVFKNLAGYVHAFLL